MLRHTVSTAAMATLRNCMRALHTHGAVRLPRNVGMPTRAASRFGNFDRLTPPSLQPVDVTKWKRREVPTEIKRPPYAESGEPPEWEGDIPLLDENGIEKMTAAGALAKRILDMGGKLCQVRRHPS